MNKTLPALITAVLVAIFGPKVGSVDVSTIGTYVATAIAGFGVFKHGPTVARTLPRVHPRWRPIAMYDGVTLRNVQKLVTGTDAVGCYVTGTYANYAEAKQRFPHARLLGISPTSAVLADCLDIEPGDASPPAAASWVKRAHAQNVKRPCLYTDLSELPAVMAALRAARIPRTAVRIWIAHPNGVKHICGPRTCGKVPFDVDGTQWLFAGTYDRSRLRPDFFN